MNSDAICGVILASADVHSRDAHARSLAAAGYAVFEVMSTDEALSYLESRGGIHLVIADHDMPGCLSGLTLARFVHRRWPHIGIIISGWPLHSIPALPELVTFLPQPCPSCVLVDHVRTRLAATTRSEGS